LLIEQQEVHWLVKCQDSNNFQKFAFLGPGKFGKVVWSNRNITEL